jgi:hypothetical protein
MVPMLCRLATLQHGRTRPTQTVTSRQTHTSLMTGRTGGQSAQAVGSARAAVAAVGISGRRAPTAGRLCRPLPAETAQHHSSSLLQPPPVSQHKACGPRAAGTGAVGCAVQSAVGDGVGLPLLLDCQGRQLLRGCSATCLCSGHAARVAMCGRGRGCLQSVVLARSHKPNAPGTLCSARLLPRRANALWPVRCRRSSSSSPCRHRPCRSVRLRLKADFVTNHRSLFPQSSAYPSRLQARARTHPFACSSTPARLAA